MLSTQEDLGAVGMGVEKLDLACQTIGQRDIVAIEECDVRTARELEAAVPRVGQAAILLVFDHSPPGVIVAAHYRDALVH